MFSFLFSVSDSEKVPKPTKKIPMVTKKHVHVTKTGELLLTHNENYNQFHSIHTGLEYRLCVIIGCWLI